MIQPRALGLIGPRAFGGGLGGLQQGGSRYLKDDPHTGDIMLSSPRKAALLKTYDGLSEPLIDSSND
jgi:hypothetical protein